MKALLPTLEYPWVTPYRTPQTKKMPARDPYLQQQEQRPPLEVADCEHPPDNGGLASYTRANPRGGSPIMVDCWEQSKNSKPGHCEPLSASSRPGLPALAQIPFQGDLSIAT